MQAKVLSCGVKVAACRREKTQLSHAAGETSSLVFIYFTKTDLFVVSVNCGFGRHGQLLKAIFLI